MGKNVFIGLIALLVMIGCKPDTNGNVKGDPSKPNVEESFKRVIADGDYNFQTEYIDRLDTSYLDVLYKGKKVDRFGYKGKITSEALADLNKDKQNELYLVVQKNKLQSVYGYDFESGEVNEIKKRLFKEDLPIVSVSYSILRDQLVEKFAVKSKEGKVEHRSSRYNLVKKDGEYSLLPEGWHPQDLAKMEGQYAERDAGGAGYYKVMMLKNLGNGDWEIDIKVKQNGSKAVICDFTGTGYFLDQNLIVPLNDVNPNLKGSLKIRFLDLMAAVYTADPDDSKEMVSFCNGVGSIAGNFKKTSI